MSNKPLVFRLLKFLHEFTSKDKTPLLCAYLTCVANYTDEKEGTPCWASVKTLANDMGCSARSVHRIQSKAVKLGLLEVKNRSKNNNKLSNYLILKVPDLKLNTETIGTDNLSPGLRQKRTKTSDKMAYNKLNNTLNDNDFAFKGSIFENEVVQHAKSYFQDLKDGKSDRTWLSSWGAKPTDPDYQNNGLLKRLGFNLEDFEDD